MKKLFLFGSFFNINSVIFKVAIILFFMSLTTIVVSVVGITKTYEMNQVANTIFFNNSTILYPLSDTTELLIQVERISARAMQGNRSATSELSVQIPNVSGQIGYFINYLSAEKAKNVQTQMDKYTRSLRTLYNELTRGGTSLATAYVSFQKESSTFGALLYEINKETRVLGLTSYNKGKNIFKSVVNLQIIISVIGLLVSIVIGLAVSFSIIRPLQQLRNTTNLLAEGDLNARVKIQTKDEVAAVGLAFNTAIDELKKMVTETATGAVNITTASNSLFDATNETSKSLGELNLLVTDLANGATTQTHTVDSTIKIFQKVTEEVNSVAGATTQLIEGNCKEASLAALQGEKAAADMTEVIDNLVQTVTIIAKMVQELAEDSQKIKQFTGVIHEISERTNLLSLNASIEAARAGAQGRGFAVVANNIRQLANQAQESVYLIETVIGEIDRKSQHAILTVENGTEQVTKGRGTLLETANLFKNLVSQVDTIVRKISEITKTATQMAFRNKEAIEAMADISRISEDNMAAVEEVSATFEEQYALTRVVSDAARQLQIMAEQMKAASSKFII